MRACGGLLAFGSEQPVEPALALGREGTGALDARAVDCVEDRAQRDAFLVFVANDRIGNPRDLRLERVAVPEQVSAQVVEGG